MYTASKEHHSLGSLTSVQESYETPLYVNGKTQQRPWGSSVFLPRGQSVEKMKLNIKYWLCIFEEQGWRHPRKPRASKGMGREGRNWEREKRRVEGRGREIGKGKPWEASLYRSFLDRRVNTISEVWNRSARMTKETGEVQLAPSKLHSKICLLTRWYPVNRFRWLLSASITDRFLACVPTI